MHVGKISILCVQILSTLPANSYLLGIGVGTLVFQPVFRAELRAVPGVWSFGKGTD